MKKKQDGPPWDNLLDLFEQQFGKRPTFKVPGSRFNASDSELFEYLRGLRLQARVTERALEEREAWDRMWQAASYAAQTIDSIGRSDSGKTQIGPRPKEKKGNRR